MASTIIVDNKMTTSELDKLVEQIIEGSSDPRESIAVLFALLRDTNTLVRKQAEQINEMSGKMHDITEYQERFPSITWLLTYRTARTLLALFALIALILLLFGVISFTINPADIIGGIF